MIFKEQASTIQKIGDIKSNSVYIDSNNLDFIITILSTNLYSNPLESFLRETVSNAWDSHVEAGVEEPIILELGEDLQGGYYCKIQDFGVGLSPERFENIYRNIGSSTKRESKDAIGGFGIGRFSALSYSPTVYITSVYDGIKTGYVMYKDNSTISIDELYSIPVDESNGVEVKVPVESEQELRAIREAIRQQLVYFENLHVIDNTESSRSFAKEFNEFVIKKYENFRVNTLNRHDGVSLLLGKVVYPLRFLKLNRKYSSIRQIYPVALTFEIGEIPVTPNREEIMYNPSSIALIEKRLDAAIEEIMEMAKVAGKKDYTDAHEYSMALDDRFKLTLVEKDMDDTYVYIPDEMVKLTLNGKSYDKLTFQRHISVYDSTKIFSKGYFYDGSRISSSKQLMTVSSVTNAIARGSFYVCDVSKLKNLSKSYIRGEFDSQVYFQKPIKKSRFIKLIVKNLQKVSLDSHKFPQLSWDYDSDILREIFKSDESYLAGVKVFNDSKVPKEWIEEYKEKKKAKRQTNTQGSSFWEDNINLGVVRGTDNYGSKVTTDTKNYPLEKLEQKFKKLTIYTFKGDERVEKVFNTFRNIVLVEVAPTKMKLLKNIDNFVLLDNFMDIKYKEIRDLATMKYLMDNHPHITSLYQVHNLDKISTHLYKVVQKLGQFMGNTNKKYVLGSDLHEEIYDLCLNSNSFNHEIMGLVKGNEKLLENAKAILAFKNKRSRYSTLFIPDDMINLIVDYLLARKLLRPNLEAVKKLKEETIFNNENV